MLCPTCGKDQDPAAQAKDIAICAWCGETVALSRAGHQKAAYADVQTLSDLQFKTLRQARAKVLASKPR